MSYLSERAFQKEKRRVRIKINNEHFIIHSELVFVDRLVIFIDDINLCYKINKYKIRTVISVHDIVQMDNSAINNFYFNMDQTQITILKMLAYANGGIING